MAGKRGLQAPVRTPNYGTYNVPFRATVSGGVVSQASHQGGESLTITRNGTGDFTITAKQPGRRFLLFAGMPISETADLKCHSVGAPTATALRILFTNNSATAVDPAGFHGAVIINDAQTLI